MTITISQPELKALIQHQMAIGAFRDIEDVLLHALKSLPCGERSKTKSKTNFADFLLASPLRDSGLILERTKDYPRPVSFERFSHRYERHFRVR